MHRQGSRGQEAARGRAPRAEPACRRYLRFWKDDLGADLDDELRFHIEMRVQEYVAAGMDPQAARDEAMRRFGDLERVRADMAAVTRQLAVEQPQSNSAVNAATVAPLHDAVVGEVRPALLVLLAAVAFVLLIACANVANLLLAKASTREREFAIRTALGASRWRVVRQLLTESLLLALAGGAAGVGLAAWGARALIALSADQLPRAGEVGLDGRVLAFALGVTVLTGLLFGLVPALRMSSPHLQPMLKEGGRGTVGGGRRVRSALVVAEVALAVVLVTGAGLMAKSLGRLLAVDAGFRPERVVAVNLTIPPERYETDEKMIGYYRAVIDGVRAVPGVQSAGAVEVDETYVGGRKRKGQRKPGRPHPDDKAPVLAMVERKGRVRARALPNVTAASLKQAIREHCHPSSRLLTDEFPTYRKIGAEFEGGHETVCHSADEFARGDVHTNTVEGFFSLLKRGMNGVYHSVSRAHLHRYLSEFEFRYNTRHLDDGARTVLAIQQADGRRLTYKEQIGRA